MEQKAGVQIGKKSFIQSLVIIFCLMMAAGVLTWVVPSGKYDRIQQDGREIIDSSSFQFVEKPDYPIWRWFTAPIEVFSIGPDRMTVIVLVLFILLVGSSFAVMDKSGILRSVLGRLVKRFSKRKYILLLIVCLFFMLMGAFFGILEEIVPLVPLLLGLSFALGWDSLVGLGMSILAANMGFSAAITNPFTVGIAQKIAGLPTNSGAWLRVIIFIVIYTVFGIFLVRYARKIEKDPQKSPVFKDETRIREKYRKSDLLTLGDDNPRMKAATICLVVFLVLILVMFFAGSFAPAITDFILPIVGLLFVIGGLSSGVISGMGGKNVGKAMRDGLTGILPSVPLILMAASVKYIAASGGIMDTVLNSTAQLFQGISPMAGALVVFGIALVIEIFVPSGSAKAFLIMPILLPVGDMLGLTRQVAVTAYCFGDGFTNMAYPTNALLLIALGLTVVSYPKWIRWTVKLWLIVAIVAVVFLLIGVAIHYGPF